MPCRRKLSGLLRRCVPWLLAVSLSAANPDSMESIKPAEGVQWRPLLNQTLTFLGIQHGFRMATEPGTRTGMKGPFLSGWIDSLKSLHGWSDGDPFLVNYIGHPMQGAVAGYLWVHNDPKFRTAEFGRNARYWKSRLRAAAYSWAYSTQFELGPLSEASLGKVQNSHPQQGLVDHVITPTLGLAWQVGEDALDRTVIQRIEDRVSTPWVRAAVRSGLNPSRSFANVLRWKVPWYRDTRPGIFAYRPGSQPADVAAEEAVPAGSRPAFEFTALSTVSHFWGPDGSSSTCPGGTGVGQFRMSERFSLVGEAGGCKLLNLPQTYTGDVVSFLAGPRVHLRDGRRWDPFVEFLVGGQRITLDRIPAVPGASLPRRPERLNLPPPANVTTAHRTDALVVAAGGGVNVILGRAFALRLADLRYSHAMVPSGSAASLDTSLRLSVGLTLRVGTW